jgi:hypothetical protein
VQNFLVVYDTSSNQAKIRSFDDLTDANTARSKAESENDSNLEIVVVSAYSLESLKASHSRYFKTLPQILDELR